MSKCLLVSKVLYIIVAVFYFFVSICLWSEVFVAGCADVLVSSSKMWLFPFWKWMHHTPPKHWYILTVPNDITTHKTVILSFSMVCCILAITSLFLDLWHANLCPTVSTKGRVVPLPSIKGYSGSGNVAPLILSLSSRWRCVVNFTS
jgi:hypothetical protein